MFLFFLFLILIFSCLLCFLFFVFVFFFFALQSIHYLLWVKQSPTSLVGWRSSFVKSNFNVENLYQDMNPKRRVRRSSLGKFCVCTHYHCSFHSQYHAATIKSPNPKQNLPISRNPRRCRVRTLCLLCSPRYEPCELGRGLPPYVSGAYQLILLRLDAGEQNNSRRHIAKEILDTEEEYVKRLRAITEVV